MTADPTPMPKKRLSAEAAGTLVEFLAEGVEHGVQLPEVFRALADDLPNRRLQAVARSLAAKIEEGETPEDALNSLKSVLPTPMRRALVVGAKTGNLSGILTGLAESEIARRKMRRGLIQVLAYPLLVLGLLMLVLSFEALFVVPPFVEIYEDFDLDLPQLTTFVLRIAETFPFVLLSLAVIGLVGFVVGLQLVGTRFVHWIRTAVPLFGRAWLWDGQHEFAMLMATLTGQKITIQEALACTGDSLRDRNLARATRLASIRCEQGDSLSKSLSDSIHFDSTLTSLVEWGEADQALPAAFREAAHTYQQQMDSYLQFLRRVLPPLMLSVVALVLFFSVAALFMPLVNLMSGLTG